MYQAASHFVLAGLSQEWVIAMQNTIPPEHFSNTYEIDDTIPEAIPPHTTAIIFADPAMADDDLLRQMAGASVRLILCTDVPAFLNHHAFAMLDDIWPATATAEVARFYFSHLLKDIKAVKEAWLDHRYLSIATENETDLIWLKDLTGVYLRVNDAFCRAAGKERAAILGHRYEEVWKAEESSAHAQPQPPRPITEPDALPTGIANVTEETVVSTTGLRRIQTVHHPLTDVGGETIGTIGIGRDVTDLRKYELRLRHAASTDELTGLANRRSFFEYIVKHRGEAPLTVARMKLRHLRHLNDTYGVQKGDEALIAMAGFLRRTFPEAVLCRFGGGEFLIGQTGLDLSASFKEKFLDMLIQIRQYCDSNQKPLLPSANMGISSTADPKAPLDKLIRQCDLALYYARNLGEGQCCVFSEIISE
ncbi:MAG: diguanylate cyclase domain-containing protein [Schwartzia sp. (in: firmicutes)]